MRRHGLWEHVFDFKAGIYIPLRHIVFLHGVYMLLGQLLVSLALSHYLHNLERHGGVKTLVHKVNHNAVSCSDNLGNGAYVLGNQILGVSLTKRRFRGKGPKAAEGR